MSVSSQTPLKVEEERNSSSVSIESVDYSSSNFRIVHMNAKQEHKFGKNTICTAKYNILSFLPKFLFEQFRRYSNLFFLFITLLQQIPGVSPIGRYTTIVPLGFILAVSALKELVEDLKRHKADDEENNYEIQNLKHGSWNWTKWKDVNVGDILRIKNGSYLPVDLLLLATTEENSTCYIETANLDGETNLKIRQGHPATAGCCTAEDLSELRGTITCGVPNGLLYDFAGVLRMHGEDVSLGIDHMLLRGAKMKNTHRAYGIALYTGHETKLMMNMNAPPLKRSTIDKITNNQILMLFAILIALCLMSTIFSYTWADDYNAKSWYLGMSEQSDKSTAFGYTFITFVILYNNLIPISLQVTLEVVRYIQAIFINMDIGMYYEETDTPALARTSNLNEELGRVQYIFSDKTGTLTQNSMVFKRCSIAGVKYDLSEDDLTKNRVIEIMVETRGSFSTVREFFTIVALCHTVEIENKTNQEGFVYQASSPDEASLINGAKNLGFTFAARSSHSVTIKFLDELEEYEHLNTLEFTSDRKRMSVIIRMPDGVIKLFCKGADSVIYDRLAPHQKISNVTQEHLDEFSRDGLRTLCVAYTDLTPGFYEVWKKKYRKASTTMHFREQHVNEVAELIEKDLILLGATAVEDKLQEGVPQAISDFLEAGIKLWILTGDKQETAINIGYSCRLLNSSLLLIKFNKSSFNETVEFIKYHIHLFNEISKKNREVALITDGKTLKFALLPEVKKEFVKIAIFCKAVICCRVSPIQKAEVVEMVQSATNVVTLAIGDGANDVAMIQAARVGVGIHGVEGQQASRASDYAIAQFRFLTRLLFVHGAWNHERLSKLILYFFHKNICLYVIELWFAIVSAWSGQIVFQRWTISLYNLVFTAAPPLAIGLFDRTCSAEARLKFPMLYDHSETSQSFNLWVFWIWVLNSILQSIILFWGTYFMMRQEVLWSTGRTGSILALGDMVYTYVIVAICLKAGLEMNAWNWLTHVAIFGSIASWFIFLWFYSHCWPTLPIASAMAGEGVMMFSSTVFWFGLILIPTTTLLGDFCFKVLRRSICGTMSERVLAIESMHPTIFK